jgi:hypothetical protein
VADFNPLPGMIRRFQAAAPSEQTNYYSRAVVQGMRLDALAMNLFELHRPEAHTLLTMTCVQRHYHHRSDPKADPFLPSCQEEVMLCSHCSRRSPTIHVRYPCSSAQLVIDAMKE